MYQLSDYDYHLPAHLIAQHPVADRKGSRLMALDRHTGGVSHHRFSDIVGMLSPSDILVVNDTRVIPGRLLGRKATGGKTEVLLIDYAGGKGKKQGDRYTFECECLVKASKRPRAGTEVHFAPGLSAIIAKHHGEGVFTVLFSSGEPFEKAIENQGRVPLPPYIDRSNDNGNTAPDTAAYQTVYAAENGAVAAPTAGLHFTGDLLEAIRAKGVAIHALTLHVSYGTFMPVREADIRRHKIHTERYSVDPKTADAINAAKKAGGRVVAVGTTSVRTLEYLADENGRISAGSGSCDLFIYPGYRFAIVDKMITNFHLPKSTLLMLVSAFAGKDAILEAYQAAINEKYRFYSYGDAMFIG
ncbi:MAG: tRNA preQ1(34) S-adenosylmethionine ribosyltransferase-isomerase QueA [Desulfosalsimonadaceae bacterium]